MSRGLWPKSSTLDLSCIQVALSTTCVNVTFQDRAVSDAVLIASSCDSRAIKLAESSSGAQNKYLVSQQDGFTLADVYGRNLFQQTCRDVY